MPFTYHDLDQSDDTIIVGAKHRGVKERQKIFDPYVEKDWTDIEFLKSDDIPDGFDWNTMIDHISSFELEEDGEEIKDATEKPSEKGRRLFMQLFIKSVWFIKTDTMLLISANVRASQKRKMR